MYIQPNTVIKIYNDIPLTPDYNHTYRFSSITAQNSFFHYTKQPKYIINNNTYQRVEKGVMRVGIKSDNLYDCNYIAFQNINYGNKWFYAFITGVEFVNNETAQITFVIDIMQTYLFDVVLKECFVEREHTATDKLFEHLVEEPVGIGDNVVIKQEDNVLSKTYNPTALSESFIHIVIVPEVFDDGSHNISIDELYKTSSGKTALQNADNWKNVRADAVDNSITSCAYYSFTNNDTGLNSLSTFVANYIVAGKGEDIISVYSVPEYTLKGLHWSNGTYFQPTAYAQETRALIVNVSSMLPDSFKLNLEDGNGYTPKNKKLFIYPYCYLEVNNYNGTSQIYRFEDLNTSNENFTGFFSAILSFQPNATTIIKPDYYKGDFRPIEMGVPSISPVQGNVANDNFLTWWSRAQASYMPKAIGWALRGSLNTTNKMIMGAIGGLSQGSVGAIAGGVAGGVNGVVSSYSEGIDFVTNSLADIETHKRTPDSVMGNINTFSSLYTAKNVDFKIQCRGLRKEYAIMIDNFFSLYGYKVAQIKVPNITKGTNFIRPHWNYIKTNICNLEPVVDRGCPADDLASIKAIYNKGITFWNPTSFGNYELDNSPV